MDVDEDPVMPRAGNEEGDANGVVVPPDEDAHRVKERRALAQVPMAPVDGSAPGTAEADAVMAQAEEIKAEQKEAAEDSAAAVKADEDDEPADDDDLFGDDGDDDDGEDVKQDEDLDQKPSRSASLAAKSGEDGEELTEAELERRRRLEYAEEDDEAVPLVDQKMQYAEMHLPNIPMASATQRVSSNQILKEQMAERTCGLASQLYHAKLPNFLNLEAAPFDPTSYAGDESTNVPVENTIRWRWKPTESDKPAQKQTNARIIRWNDGSMSLQLGSEIFDIATDRTATGKAVPPPAAAGMSNPGQSDSTTYLVAQHPYAGLLETQARVSGNLTFRPTAIQSTSHRKIASNFAAQQVRKSKTVMIQAEMDPEVEKALQERKQKAARKPRAARGEGAGSRKSGRRSVRSTNLADFSDNDFPSDEEADAAGERARKAERKAKLDRDREELGDFIATESEDDDGEAEDDDEGDDPEAQRRRERRRQRSDDAGIADDLDEMEAQAERMARAERKTKKDKIGTSTSRAAEDIDSDDLDKSGDEAFVRKKLVVESDEE